MRPKWRFYGVTVVRSGRNVCTILKGALRDFGVGFSVEEKGECILYLARPSKEERQLDLPISL